MFRKNEGHRQQEMFTTVEKLPETARRRLEGSWCGTFYQEFFCRIQENDFSVLYSRKRSRPNTPVNVLVGLEALKSGFGWSDEELYDQYLFNMKVRYALGLRRFDEGYFDLRTLYNFRSALTEYEREHEVDLIAKTYQKITDGQIERFAVATGTQRMDSTLVQSNIRNMSRLQLVVEVVQRVWAMLSTGEQERFALRFEPFVREDSLHYCYRVKPGETPVRLQLAGELIRDLIAELRDTWGHTTTYAQMERVFSDHFRLDEERIVLKEGKELSGASLQSPHDTEATYRKKGKDAAKGYVANITETCEAENDIQLVTQVSVAPNVTDDQQLLSTDVEELKDRMAVDTLWTDGGYTGETAHETLGVAQIDHRVTAVKGKRTDGLGLDAFDLTIDAEGTPVGMCCPGGQEGIPRATSKPGRYSCAFHESQCSECPLSRRCPGKRLKRKPFRVVRFSKTDMRVAAQRRQVTNSGSDKNIRAAVESTVRSVIHPFGGHLCKLPVRGRSRVTTMVILSAAMVNVRRIAAHITGRGTIQLATG